MEIALTTLLLLPGLISLTVAAQPRCRAITPREMPAALAAAVGFSALNFVLTALLYRLVLFGLSLSFDWPAARGIGEKVTALLMGQSSSGYTREKFIASVIDGSWRIYLFATILALITWVTGYIAARLYMAMLRQTLIEDRILAGNERREWLDRFLGRWLSRLNLSHLSTTRGAGYWLVVLESARMRFKGSPWVYADIFQGKPGKATLYNGQVIQVIADPTGEVASIVLRAARRFVPAKPGEVVTPGDMNHTQHQDGAPANGETPPRGGYWRSIENSEAFYVSGKEIINISYYAIGEPTRDVSEGLVGKEKIELPADVKEILVAFQQKQSGPE